MKPVSITALHTVFFHGNPAALGAIFEPTN